MKANFVFIIMLFLGCQNIEPQKDKASSQEISTIIETYHHYQDSLREANKTKWGLTDEAAFEQQKQFFEKLSQSLTTLSKNKLSEEDLINKEVLDLIVANELSELNFGYHYMPFNAEGGFYIFMLYKLSGINLSDAEKEKEYLNLLGEIPNYFSGLQTLLKKGIEKQKVPPKLIVEKCLDLMKGYLITPPETSIFINPAHTSNNLTATKQQIIEILEKQVNPAFQDMVTFLEKEYMPHAAEKIGISALPNGKQFYEEKVRYYTTLEMSPNEVYQTGEREVARIRAEMEKIIVETGFKGDFPAFLNFLRTDPQFYAKTPQELLNTAAWLSKKIEAEMPQAFGKMPRMPFTVKPVPAAIAPNYTGGRYSEGSYENHKAGQYWVNTYKLESRPLYVLPALTLHEAVPGHHLQIMLAQELENVPRFREELYISAFGEGWGLYSEYLGTELGMYESPYEDFGRLTYEMWRACRLVVDVGMHYKGMTRAEAVKIMAENTALSLHEVNTEIDRYIGWPGQAVSYKIGELKIRALRQQMEEKKGDDFDIRAFHDKILAYGSIPLGTLERLVINNE